jgi:nicotinamide/nicotinate riboside kinase
MPDINSDDVEELIIEQLRKRFEELNNIQFVIIDGFLLYHDETLLPLYDVKLFLSADKSVLVERRNARAGYVTIEGEYTN